MNSFLFFCKYMEYFFLFNSLKQLRLIITVIIFSIIDPTSLSDVHMFMDLKLVSRFVCCCFTLCSSTTCSLVLSFHRVSKWAIYTSFSPQSCKQWVKCHCSLGSFKQILLTLSIDGFLEQQ